MGTREKNRDDREYDTTQLHESGHGKTLHRDYSAHFWRWSFARRFITPKDNVLEVGCGEDRPLSKILTGGAAPHVNTYTGVDLNKLKESASQRLRFYGEFNFVEQYKKLLKQPLPNGKSVGAGFDVIVHYEVIEHMKVQNGAAMLRACFASLRPGGTMLMSTPCYDGKRHAANHIHEYTIPELQKASEKAGFKVVRRFGTFMDVKHLKKSKPQASTKQGDLFVPDQLAASVPVVAAALAEYFDSDAISNIFGPLYPDNARNNLWVCRKEK